jgi:hypothetical protein
MTTKQDAIKLALEAFRDTVLNQRGALAENGMTNDQVNDVLSEFDAALSAISEAPVQPDDALLNEVAELRSQLMQAQSIIGSVDFLRLKAIIDSLSQSAQPSDDGLIQKLTDLRDAGYSPDWFFVIATVSNHFKQPSEQAVAPAQAMPEPQEIWIICDSEDNEVMVCTEKPSDTMLKRGWSVKEYLLYPRNAAPQPNHEQSGTDTQARDEIIEQCAKACEKAHRGGMEIQGTQIYFDRCAEAIRQLKGSK